MLKKIEKNKLLISITLLLSIVIILITQKIINGQELMIDKFAYNILVENLRTEKLTTFMKLVTKLGNTEFVLPATVLLMFIFYYVIKNKKLSITIAANLILIVLVNQVLKFIFQRERPLDYRLIEMTGYSFPSGHAMASLAFYGLLIYITYKLIPRMSVKILLIFINLIIIILIGISRVYLGVHYLSDVITGYSISLIYLMIEIKFLNKWHVFP